MKGLDAAAPDRTLTRRGPRSDVVLFWSLFCACYWLYPLWSRGHVSWDLKFAVLAAYTVAFVVLLGRWEAASRDPAETLAPPMQVATTAWGTAAAVALAVAGALQLWESRLPILSGPDEPYRVTAALQQWRAITAADVATVVLALVSAALLWLAGLVLLSKLRPLWARMAGGVGLLAVGLALNHEMMLTVGTSWGESPRWPPLGTLLEVLSFSVLGPGEAAARLPSLAFYLATAVVLYRLVARELPPSAAFVAEVSLLSSPAFFTQGHIASRETAGAFFMTAAAALLLRWWRRGRGRDLGWAFAMTLAAYLTRRPAGVFAGVVLVVVALRAWRRWRVGDRLDLRPVMRAPALGMMVLVGGAIPWAFSTRTIRPFELALANWLNPALVVAYPAWFPAAMGLAVTALGVAGAVAAARRWQPLPMLALLWLATVYALFTSDVPRWVPTWRFVALMCPAWAVLAGAGFQLAAERVSGRTRAALAALFAAAAAVSIVTWSRCAPSPGGLLAAPCREAAPRYPFDQAVAWLGEHRSGPVVVTPATYWQTSLDVYAAFEGEAAVREYVPPFGSPTPPLTVRDVLDVCQAASADLVVVPSRREAGKWVPLFMARSEADRLAVELGRGAGTGIAFTRGPYRLELYPCAVRSPR